MAEEQPDPASVHTRADLARELTALRTAAGLSVRELARRVDAPAATLGGYFAGSHLPRASQLQRYRAILTECGVEDAEDLEQWRRALDRARFSSDGRAAKADAPYRGLKPFAEADTELFFGRAAATAELLDRLRALRDDPGPSAGVLVLVGPSGSGKSSLLGAGVVPAVRQGALDGPGRSWDCVLTTPGPAGALLDRRPARDEQPLLLVVDQFEELLADSTEPEARAAFLEGLACHERAATLVVLGLRADYYGAAATEPVLLAALRHAQVLLGPMTEAEVREAIAQPARAVGTTVEDSLVDLLLADLAPGSPAGLAHGAGALPLLSHALLVTWQRAERNQLTVADYRAVGGLRGAVLQSAEGLYRSLSPAEQEVARRIFARLVRIEGDGPLTRRRVLHRELDAVEEQTDPPGAVDRVLERFFAARLLTADAGAVYVSHEALLGAWPRLAGWIDADRDGLRLHHRLSDAVHAWDSAGRDESHLWRGTSLETVAEWAATEGHEKELNRTERDFLRAALAHRDIQRRAARRGTRRIQQLLALVATLALVASVLAAYAFDARSSANRARDAALSRQVAIEAQQLRGTEPALAAQLALAAYRIAPTVQAHSTLIEATGAEMPFRLLGPTGPEFLASADHGRLLAVARSAADSVELYSLHGGRPTPRSRLTVGPPSQQDFAVALSPDGRLLAAGDTAGKVVLWNVADPRHPSKLATLGGFSSTVYSVAFGPGGRQLAAADNDGTIGQWDLSDPSRPVAEPTLDVPGAPPMKTVAYSPDGRLAAAAGGAGTLVTWTPGLANLRVVPGAGTATLEAVAFSPDGSTLATGGDDHNVRLWTVRSSGRLQVAGPPFSPGPTFVMCLAFSPDGSRLAACSDGSVVVYDTRTWTTETSLPVPNPPTAALFSPGGSTLTTADAGGVTRRWRLPPPATEQLGGSAFFVQYTPTGKRLMAVTQGTGGDVSFWDVAAPLRPKELATVHMPTGFGPVAGTGTLAPGGHLLAVANARAEIQLVDVTDLRHPRPIGPLLHGNHPYVEQIAFSPNGKVLAAGDDSGQVRLWDVADPARPRALPTLKGTKGKILGMSISHDGRLLAAATTGGKVLLYDIADPARSRLLATLGGFSSYAYDTAFTHHDRTLVAGSADGTLRLWTLADPARPALQSRILSGLTGDIYQIAVSPDGRTLAVSTTEHQVGLWNIADPARPTALATLTTGKGAVFAVTFDPRRPVLAATGDQQTLYLWDYSVTDAAKLVCADTGHAITRTEWSEYVPGLPYDPPCAHRSPA